MNEVMMICDRLKIDFHNVLNLAKTKWNFLNFEAGLVGGHCLPVDPYYLYDLAKINNFDAKFILAGRNVNNHMVNYVENKIMYEVKKRNIKTILLSGLTFKKNVSDIRNSLSLKIFKNLKKQKKIKVEAADPLIKKNKSLKIINLSKIKIHNYDLIVNLVDHDILRNFFLKYYKKNNEKFLDIFNFYG